MIDLLTLATKAACIAIPAVVPHLHGKARYIGRVMTWRGLYAVKTYEGYFRQLWNRTNELYNGEIGEDEFIDTLAELIQEQITRAWRAALRDSEMSADLVNSDYADNIEAMILSEFEHVDQFAADILEAAAKGSGVDEFRSRCELWANRYNDAYNNALLEISETGDRFVWIYGDTEHCETCAQLNGLVATAQAWEEAGFHPQQPPNDLLSCGGWRCQCRLERTEQRSSPKVLETLINIAVSRNL